MGRVSELFNGYRSRPAFLSNARKGGGGVKNVSIDGFEIVERMIDRILVTDPTMDRFVRKLIAKVTREARKRVSKDIAGYMKNDPRKAARAVKHTVYRKVFGSNISILAKKKASNGGSPYTRPRKLDHTPNQRGGNRRRRNDKTVRLDSYFASDRGFALRFLNAGTDSRETRFGNRGSIYANYMFARIAPWHLEEAVDEISDAVAEYITYQAHG